MRFRYIIISLQRYAAHIQQRKAWSDGMDKLPFNVYDFFAYLSSGAVVIIVADNLLHLGLTTQRDIAPIHALGLIILAYVLGHVVAHFSSLLLERLLVHKVLQSPSSVLLGTKARWGLNLVFPNYYRPLSATTIARVRKQAADRKCDAKGEGLFQHVFALVTAVAEYQSRLDAFRNQYGFARNMSFAFLVSASSIEVAHFFGNPVRLRWAVFALFIGLTLLYRYLKFFRQYTYELFLRYSELPMPSEISRAAGA